MAFKTAKNKGCTQISLCQWHNSHQFQWLRLGSQACVLSTGLALLLERPDRRCHRSMLQCCSGQQTALPSQRNQPAKPQRDTLKGQRDTLKGQIPQFRQSHWQYKWLKALWIFFI